MPSLTVTQNIALPLRLGGRRPRRSEVREVAARVELDKRLRHRPSQLSGGQQQRVATARALVSRPEVVFADEPTGALDTETGRGVLALLREVVDGEGHTVVMVTHDPQAAAYADRSDPARRRTARRDARGSQRRQVILIAGALIAPAAAAEAERVRFVLRDPAWGELVVACPVDMYLAAARRTESRGLTFEKAVTAELLAPYCGTRAGSGGRLLGPVPTWARSGRRAVGCCSFGERATTAAGAFEGRVASAGRD